MLYTINYKIEGGTPIYTASILGPLNKTNNHNTDGTYSFTDMPEGNYILKIEDSIGCIIENEITLN